MRSRRRQVGHTGRQNVLLYYRFRGYEFRVAVFLVPTIDDEWAVEYWAAGRRVW